MTGFVYFLRCGDFVKIGFSKKPQSRTRYLRTGLPFDFELLGSHPGSLDDEHTLHKIFSKFHHRYEWFHCSEEILEAAKNGLSCLDAARRNKLGEYLAATHRTIASFAYELHLQRSIVRSWVLGERPRPADMQKITFITKGAVMPNDWEAA